MSLVAQAAAAADIAAQASQSCSKLATQASFELCQDKTPEEHVQTAWNCPGNVEEFEQTATNDFGANDNAYSNDMPQTIERLVWHATGKITNILNPLSFFRNRRSWSNSWPKRNFKNSGFYT